VGLEEWSSSKIYIGEFKRNARNGFGIMKWDEMKKKYIGQWRNGKQHGIGYFKCQGKSKRKGEWEDGVRVRWF
jgi:hypothetical protein